MDIVERLKEHAVGREEWRIANPDDGSYVISFSYGDTLSPERDAREWLADHLCRNPTSWVAGYEVRKVMAQSDSDMLMIEAADEIASLRAQAKHESDCAEAYKAEADRLRDENAKLRADAERYAFLRDSTCCSLILSRNEDHACNYVAAKQWIEEFGTENDWSDVPPDELQRMKDTNTIWALQIYPNTPVGFNRWSRSTLDAAIDAAMQKGE